MDIDAAIDNSLAIAASAVSHSKDISVKIPDAIQDQVELYVNEVDGIAALDFLKGDDGAIAKEIATLLREGIKKIVADQALGLADVPVLIQTTGDIAKQITLIKDRRGIVIAAGKGLAIPLARFIVMTVLKATIPGGQFTLIAPIVTTALGVAGHFI